MTCKARIALSLLLITFLSGCIGDYLLVTDVFPIPAGGDSYGPDPQAIEEEATTRIEILKDYGEPGAQTPDRRFMLYDYGGSFSYYNTGALNTHRTDTSFMSRVLLEFDNNDRVKRVHDVNCGRGTTDPRCSSDRSASLLAMLEYYYDASVVRPYQRSVALCEAAATGDRSTVQALLVEGVSVNGQCQKVGTPLHEATSNPEPGVAEVLLVGGADVHAKDANGRTPLQLAASDGNLAVAKLLLDHRAEVNVKDQGNLATPLHVAVINGNVELVRLLLDHGAEVDAKNDKGRTPLQEATLYDNRVAVTLLLARHADVNAKDNHGRTPLHDAAFRGNAGLAELLIAHGAAVNVNDQDARTPLHEAVSWGSVDLSTLLLAHGAKRGVVDKWGKTPMDLATDPEVMELLKQDGNRN